MPVRRGGDILVHEMKLNAVPFEKSDSAGRQWDFLITGMSEKIRHSGGPV